MRRRRGHRSSLVAVAGLVAIAACGTGSTDVPDDVSVGAGLIEPETSTTESADDERTVSPGGEAPDEALSPPPTRAPGIRTPVTGRTDVRTQVRNRSVVDHPGWRVTLTVGDRGEFSVDETVPIEVVLTNTSQGVGHHEIDQPDSVVISTASEPDRRVWAHLDCNPTLSVYKTPAGVRAVESGEEVPMIIRYPMSESCRLPPGDYLAFGQWSVCPDDALVETRNPGTYRCEDGRAQLVDAGPVPFRLR